MTTIFDEPERFAARALEGFCDINARIVTPVRGGVLRSTQTPEGKVALVMRVPPDAEGSGADSRDCWRRR